MKKKRKDKPEIKYWPELIDILIARKRRGYDFYDKYIYQCPVCLHTKTLPDNHTEYICIGRGVFFPKQKWRSNWSSYRSYKRYHKLTNAVYERIPRKYQK